jgi:transcriptional regulator with XRE-family HTH domain
MPPRLMLHGGAMTLLEDLRRRDLTLPPRCVEIRIAAGATQADVARELRTFRETVARWEAGTRRPRGELRERYARLLEALADRVTSS